ncbi:MAG TPA: hypothetical protein VFI41_04685 [Gemmatimonadales bacterium]|nr:hypothetical protein [Gemmatimonadales bacterium]
MQVRPAWTDKATPRSKVHLTDSPVESTAPFVLTLCGQLGNGAGITMAFTTYLGYQDEACKKCVAAAAKRA